MSMPGFVLGVLVSAMVVAASCAVWRKEGVDSGAIRCTKFCVEAGCDGGKMAFYPYGTPRHPAGPSYVCLCSSLEVPR